MPSTIRAGDLSVHYELTGADTGPVVALCHSLGTTLEIWDRQIAAFSEHWRVLRFDLRGHGGTEVTPGPYSIEGLARDYLSLLDALGIDRAHYCGVSLGGFIGQWLGVNAPDRVDRLVLSNTAPYVGPPSIWQERIDLSKRAGMRAVALGAAEAWFTPEFIAREPDVARGVQRMLLHTSVEAYAAGCAAIRDMDLRPIVPRIARPTLVIGATHDGVTPPENARWMSTAIPDARLSMLDASHLSHIECSGDYNRRVTDFLIGD